MASDSSAEKDAFTVSEKREARYFGGTHPPSDSKVMTPAPVGRTEGALGAAPPRPEPGTSDVPDFRKTARSAAEVERDRPTEVPAWVGPIVGIITFVVMMAVGGFWMTLWFRHLEANRPPPPVPVEVPDDVEGVPVRKGIGE